MKSENKFVHSAPEYLINLYGSGDLGSGKKLLCKLITSKEMIRVWKELSKKVNSDKGWYEVFQIICLAKLKSTKIKRYVSNKEIQSKYKKLSIKLESLSKEIEGGHFDMPAYEFINRESLSIIGLDGILDCDSLTKSTLAYKTLKYWPTTSELLTDMSIKAKKYADDSLSVNRSSDRTNRHLKEREFICSIGDLFYKKFNTPMYGTIANITSTLFQDNNECNINKYFVQTVLSKRRGGVKRQ